MPPDTPRRFPSRLHVRLAFWAYAMSVVVATLWPRLQLGVRGLERPDLILHFLIFGAFYVLLFAAGFFPGSNRRRALITPWLVAVFFAAADESLQAIPSVGRTAAWDDFAANVAGITLGLLGAGAWMFVAAERRRDEQSPA